MPTSTRQILCEFVRADVGIRPYDAVFNTAINYNLSKCLPSLPLEGKVGFATQNSDEVER